jgi:hypothetical protein
MAFTVVTGPTIMAGRYLSNTLDVTGVGVWIGQIIFPAVWEGQPLLTFQASQDNATFCDIYEPTGKLLSVTVVPGAMVFLSRPIWRSAYFKFQSGTTQAPAVQHQARTFTCVLFS